jgi:hypothetical protein
LVNPSGKVITPTIASHGYPVFSLRVKKKQYKILAHRLAAFQKFGYSIYEPGIEVRHIQNNILDFRLDNLLIGTSTQNKNDRPCEERELLSRIAAAYARKLTDKQAEQLRADKRNGMSHKSLAAKYGISKSTVSYIVNRKHYNKLSPV